MIKHRNWGIDQKFQIHPRARGWSKSVIRLTSGICRKDFFFKYLNIPKLPSNINTYFHITYDSTSVRDTLNGQFSFRNNIDYSRRENWLLKSHWIQSNHSKSRILSHYTKVPLTVTEIGNLNVFKKTHKRLLLRYWAWKLFRSCARFCFVCKIFCSPALLYFILYITWT